MTSIQLVTDSPYYAPGSTVTAYVTTEIEKPKKARSIFVDVKGYAKVLFYRSSGETVVDFKDEVEYFNFRVTVWTPPPGENMISPGKYKLSFSFLLPKDLPPSYEGRNAGSIRYWMKAEMDIPWGFNLHSPEHFFTVLSFASGPYQAVSSYFSQNSGFCDNKSLGLRVILPKTVFFTGETIPITLKISNPDRQKITVIGAAIKSYAQFSGKNTFILESVEIEKETITTHEQDDDVQTSDASFPHHTSLQLIANCPTISNCRIIQVENFLYIVIHKAGIFTSSMTAGIPITIVTASLQSPKPLQKNASQTTIRGNNVFA